MRAGVDIHIAGAGGSVTHTLREWAVMVRNSAGAGGSGMKKTVLRRALAPTYALRLCKIRKGIIQISLGTATRRLLTTVRQVSHVTSTLSSSV